MRLGDSGSEARMLRSIVIDDEGVEGTIGRRRRGDIDAGGNGAGVEAHDVAHRRAGLCTYYGEIVDAWGRLFPSAVRAWLGPLLIL